MHIYIYAYKCIPLTYMKPIYIYVCVCVCVCVCSAFNKFPGFFGTDI